MKTSLTIGLCIMGTLLLPAQETLSSALESTTVNAQLRYYTLQRNYDELIENSSGIFNVQHKYQKASNVVGGYFGFESGSLYHFSVGATLYTSQPIFHNPIEQGGLQLIKDNQEGYTVLGEAFLKWTYDETIVKIGRQRMSDYGFLSDYDIRMTPFTYEAAILENRNLKNIILRAAYVKGVKTFVATSYIGFVNASKVLVRDETVGRNPLRGDYNPADYSNGTYIGPKKDLYLLSAVYHDKAFNFEFWDYYSDDFVNFIYATASYTFPMGNMLNTIGTQFIKQDDVGSHVAGNIDTYLYGVMLTSTYNNLTFTYAFNKTKYDENSLDGGSIIDMWGGSMIYNGLMYNGSDQGGTSSHAISLKYDYTAYNLSVLLGVGIFNLPNNITDIFADQDNIEYDAIIHYTPKWNKKLHFSIKAAYIDFDTNYDFRAYEDYHGFDMLHAYDDILDMRFIVNYVF